MYQILPILVTVKSFENCIIINIILAKHAADSSFESPGVLSKFYIFQMLIPSFGYFNNCLELVQTWFGPWLHF